MACAHARDIKGGNNKNVEVILIFKQQKFEPAFLLKQTSNKKFFLRNNLAVFIMVIYNLALIYISQCLGREQIGDDVLCV